MYTEEFLVYKMQGCSSSFFAVVRQHNGLDMKGCWPKLKEKQTNKKTFLIPDHYPLDHVFHLQNGQV